MTKLSFGRAYPTCQDVNQLTSSTKHLDLIIGFSSGDLVWYDTVCNRYSRINKNVSFCIYFFGFSLFNRIKQGHHEWIKCDDGKMDSGY